MAWMGEESTCIFLAENPEGKGTLLVLAVDRRAVLKQIFNP